MDDNIKETQGTSYNKEGDNWMVECPTCSKEYESTGWFDSEDIIECSCGTKFRTTKIWVDGVTYIK